MGRRTFSDGRSTFIRVTPLGERAMDAVLLIVAWGAGLASLFLVADMIMTDISCRRAERSAARQGEHRAMARFVEHRGAVGRELL
jgi:hypothetical protein